MPEEEIELPRASYELFISIIRSFLAVHGDENPVSTKKIAAYAGRHPAIVSQNIKAITFLGIASRDKGYTYKLTKEGADLAYSIEYNDQEGVSAAFRTLVAKNEFLKSLVFSVKSRGSISDFELRDEIGKRAKVTKKDPRATIGAQTIIDILVVSGFLKKEDNNIIATERATELLKEEVAERPPRREIKARPPTREMPIPVTEKEIPMQIQIRLDFQVPLHPKESDIESIADTIRKIRDSIMGKAKEEKK